MDTFASDCASKCPVLDWNTVEPPRNSHFPQKRDRLGDPSTSLRVKGDLNMNNLRLNTWILIILGAKNV